MSQTSLSNQLAPEKIFVQDCKTSFSFNQEEIDIREL
jgi:hypothetical protein